MKKYSIQDLRDAKVAVRLQSRSQFTSLESATGVSLPCGFHEPVLGTLGYYYRFGSHSECSGSTGYDHHAGRFYLKAGIILCEFHEIEIPGADVQIINPTILKIYKLLNMINDPRETSYQVASAIVKRIEKENGKLTESEMTTLNLIFKNIRPSLQK